MDKQLSQLDTQLVAISDYLDGKRSTMFPPNVIVYVEDTQDAVVPSTGEGRRLCGASAATGTDQFSGVVVSGDSVVPTPAAVEDDLQSGGNAAQCTVRCRHSCVLMLVMTTVWRYRDAVHDNWTMEVFVCILVLQDDHTRMHGSSVTARR